MALGPYLEPDPNDPIRDVVARAVGGAPDHHVSVDEADFDGIVRHEAPV